jgi:hypothetical protein
MAQEPERAGGHRFVDVTARALDVRQALACRFLTTN